MKQLGPKTISILMVLLVVGALGAQGQTQTTQCTSTFFTALVQLIPCRLSMAPFSLIPPSDFCCNALKALGQSCLCLILNGPQVSGIDRNLAMQLPEKCSTNFESCDIME